MEPVLKGSSPFLSTEHKKSGKLSSPRLFFDAFKHAYKNSFVASLEVEILFKTFGEAV